MASRYEENLQHFVYYLPASKLAHPYFKKQQIEFTIFAVINMQSIEGLHEFQTKQPSLAA